MEMRNLKYNHAGTVDAEINHLTYGWIPCTLSPDDGSTAPLYAEAISGIHGAIAAYSKPLALIEAEAAAELARLATVARLQRFAASQATTPTTLPQVAASLAILFEAVDALNKKLGS